MLEMMKKSIFLLIAALLAGVSCKPDKLVPPTSAVPLTSVTATVTINGYEDLEFIGYPDENNRVAIEFPYFYPLDSDDRTPEEVLSHVRVKAALANNCSISPSLLFLDLRQENAFTVTDQVKNQLPYVITGTIAKSHDCDILDFSLPSYGFSGIINGTEISIVTAEDLLPSKAACSLSPHATISPDPSTTELDFNQAVKFTVTAHDGVTKKEYTVRKSIPEKLDFGMRDGSGRLLFAKKLQGDLGLPADLTGGLAVSGDYLVLNVRGGDLKVYNRQTGAYVKDIVLPAELKGTTRNYYCTSDREGQILLCNLSGAEEGTNDGRTFKVFRLADVNAAPEPYIAWVAGGVYGRKLSVQGTLSGDAVISCCECSPIKKASFAEWTVKAGKLVDQKPVQKKLTGGGAWTTNADLCHFTADPASDYLAHFYSVNRFCWVDGATDAARMALGAISVNYIPNAVDIVAFNNSYFVATNQVNSFPWGAADFIWLLDVTTRDYFDGTLDDGKLLPTSLKWSTHAEYGARACTATNPGGSGDVQLAVSANGYYMYLYFLFTNGYVVGVQFDCIKM